MYFLSFIYDLPNFYKKYIKFNLFQARKSNHKLEKLSPNLGDIMSTIKNLIQKGMFASIAALMLASTSALGTAITES